MPPPVHVREWVSCAPDPRVPVQREQSVPPPPAVSPQRPRPHPNPACKGEDGVGRIGDGGDARRVRAPCAAHDGRRHRVPVGRGTQAALLRERPQGSPALLRQVPCRTRGSDGDAQLLPEDGVPVHLVRRLLHRQRACVAHKGAGKATGASTTSSRTPPSSSLSRLAFFRSRPDARNRRVPGRSSRVRAHRVRERCVRRARREQGPEPAPRLDDVTLPLPLLLPSPTA